MCSLLHFAVRPGRALVLPRVFCPGIHQKCFDVAVWLVEVPEHSPSVRAVTSPNASISMHCLDKRDSMLRVNMEAVRCALLPAERSWRQNSSCIDQTEKR